MPAVGDVDEPIEHRRASEGVAGHAERVPVDGYDIEVRQVATARLTNLEPPSSRQDCVNGTGSASSIRCGGASPAHGPGCDVSANPGLVRSQRGVDTPL